MNPDDGRPDWWEVQVRNLIADPEALRALLEAQAEEVRYWHQQAERARGLVILLEGELAHLEAS